MAEEGIILPSGPLFLVDRELGAPKKRNQTIRRSKIAIQKHGFSIDSPRTKNTFQSKHPQTSNISQDFQFVNTTRPGHHLDPTMQRVVRSHAMKEVARGKGRKSFESSKIDSEQKHIPNNDSQDLASDYSTDQSLGSPSSALSLAISPTGSAIPLFGACDFKINSSFQVYLQYYGTQMANAMYPLEQHAAFEFNPVSTFWLPAALTDEVLLYTILLSSALHWAHQSNSYDLRETDGALRVILQLLSERLGKTELTDATISAVSCLAMGESSRGRHDLSRIHVSGMRDMINARGGLKVLNKGLRLKIYRADVQAAVDNLSKPLLQRLPRNYPSIYDSIAPGPFPSSQFVNMISASGMDSELLSIFIELARFSAALNYAIINSVEIHPSSSEEDLLNLQYRLADISLQTEYGLEGACRLGAIMFIQSLTREAWFRKETSFITAKRMKLCLEQISNPDQKGSPLMFWCTFMGALASHETDERDWFHDRLIWSLVDLQCKSWDDVKQNLEKVLWIGVIHDNIGINLWNEVKDQLYIT